MSYPLRRIRDQFPALETGIFFDGAGGTQTPVAVTGAIAAALRGALSQRGRAYPGARNADDIVTAARAAMADFLGADPRGIVFGRSATQLIFDFADTLVSGLGPGDEIVVSRIDHDANIRPWVYAAERVGATIAWIDFDRDTGDVEANDVARVLTDRTRLVALTAGSNLYGTIPDIAAISPLVRATGATLFVDAVAYAPHELLDVRALGADYLVCSAYKFCGPHLGVLAGDPAALRGLNPRKLLPSTDAVPERFEHGTLPYELLAGVTATVDFLAAIAPGPGGSRRGRLAASYAAMGAHEGALAERIIAGLARIPGVRRIGAPRRATPIIYFRVEGRTAADTAEFLGERGIAVSAGTFYAHEAAQWANLGEGGIRLSLAPYSREADVEALLAAVGEFAGLRTGA